MLGDIRDEIKEVNETDFLKLLRILAARTAENLNYSAIASEAGISTYHVKNMINLLISYGIILLLPPYSGNTLKTLVKTPRLHFVDSGLCCYLLGIKTREEFLSHPLKGRIFESYVVSEIIKNARNNGDYSDFYFYREESKRKKDDDVSVAEIDLIKQDGLKLYPIEIKLNATPNISMAKHIKNFANREMGSVVCLSHKKTLLSKDILVMPVSMI